MWQLDGTEWRLDDEANTRQVVYQVEDDHSRMVLASACDRSENGQTAIRVVSDAIRAWGAPVRFLTDNGNAFNQSRRAGGGEAPLERYLKAFGVKPISGQIQKPTTQGKAERLHRTLQKFLEAHRPIDTPERLAELVDVFAEEYNNRRPHQELGGLTPAEAYAAADKAPQPQPPPAAPGAAPGRGSAPGGRPRRRPHGAYDLGGSTWVDRVVGADGRLSAAHCTIYVTRRWAGRMTHILVTDDTLEIFGPDGDFLGLVARPAPGSARARINLFSDGIHCG
jgi:hypothetical protein